MVTADELSHTIKLIFIFGCQK